MSIRIEITGDSTQEIAQSLLGLAFMIAPKLANAANPPVGGIASGVEATEAETVQPVRKPRGKKVDAPVIDHDEKENAGAVHGDGNAADSGSGAGVLPDAATENAADATETVAAAEDGTAPKDVVDPIRAHVINDYLNVVTDDLPKRKELYGALLAEFGIPAITALRVSQVEAFKAAVDAKIEAAVTGK